MGEDPSKAALLNDGPTRPVRSAAADPQSPSLRAALKTEVGRQKMASRCARSSADADDVLMHWSPESASVEREIAAHPLAVYQVAGGGVSAGRSRAQCRLFVKTG